MPHPFIRLTFPTVFLGSLQHGACVIIPTSMSFSTIELGDMISRCGLNRLSQFSPFLVHNLRAARSDPKIFSLLDNLDEVLYSGSLPREEEDWGFRSGLKLRVRISIQLFFIPRSHQYDITESLWQHRMQRHAHFRGPQGIKPKPTVAHRRIHLQVQIDSTHSVDLLLPHYPPIDRAADGACHPR